VALRSCTENVDLWHLFLAMGDTFKNVIMGLIRHREFNERVSDKPRQFPRHQRASRRTTAHFTVVSTVLCTGYVLNKTVELSLVCN
jgi:hypothetical protein